MKKLFTVMMGLMIACSTFTLTSCFGDEEEEEVIETAVREQYINDIVGYWLLDGTQEYWHFTKEGFVTRISIDSEYWDESEDIFEGEVGTNKFNWTINELGALLVVIEGESSSFEVPDELFLIKSITTTRMTWVTNNGHGEQQILNRLKPEQINKRPEDE